MSIHKLFLQHMFGLLLGVTVIASGVVALTRHMQPPTNPFTDFSDLFGDDAGRIAEARGFTCEAINFYSHPRTITDYCEAHVTHETFSQISLGLLGNYANEINFSVREHTLMVGDLAALWGKPEYWQDGENIAATWPAQHVTALSPPAQTSHISYFLPVLSVAFTRSGPPRWSLLMMMENLPMICNTCGGL